MLAPGATATVGEIIACCRECLAHYKCPTSIEFRDELSRTSDVAVDFCARASPCQRATDENTNGLLRPHLP